MPRFPTVGRRVAGRRRSRLGARRRAVAAATTTTAATRPPTTDAPTTTTRAARSRRSPGCPTPTGAEPRPPGALRSRSRTPPQARPAGRPRAADVVYEEVVEGDITRFLAMFNSTVPDVVGPVRSVRLDDPTSCGRSAGSSPTPAGAPATSTRSTQAPVNAVDENNAGDGDVPRRLPRRAPHNLFGRGSALFDARRRARAAAAAVPVPRDGRRPSRASRRATFTIGFRSGLLTRPTPGTPAPAPGTASIDGVPFTIAVGGAQIAPTNVVSSSSTTHGGVGEDGAEATSSARVTRGSSPAASSIRGRWIRPDKDQPDAATSTPRASPIQLRAGQHLGRAAPIGTAVDVVRRRAARPRAARSDGPAPSAEGSTR